MKYILGQPLSFILETTYPRSTTSATPVTIFFNWANKITGSGITQCLLSNEFTLKDSTHISVNLTTTSHMTGLLLEQVKNGDYIYITVVDIDASHNYIHKEIYHNYIQAFTSPEEAGETDNTNDNSSDVDKEEPINPYIGNNYSRNFHTSTHVYDLIDVLKASNSDIVAGQTNGAVLTYDSTKKGWYGKLLSPSDFSGGTSSGGSTTNNIVLYGPNSLNGTGDVDTSYDAIHSFNSYTINKLYKLILDNTKKINSISTGGSTGNPGGTSTPTNPAYESTETFWCIVNAIDSTPTSNSQYTWEGWQTAYKKIDKGTFVWCSDTVILTDGTRKPYLNIRLIGTAEIYKTTVFKYLQVDSVNITPTVNYVGWSSTLPEYVAGKYIWEIQIDTYPCGNQYFTTPRCISNITGDINHPDYDINYFIGMDNPTTVPTLPTGIDNISTYNSIFVAAGWVDYPTNSTQTWWVVYGTLRYHLDSDSYTVLWSSPIRVTGTDGQAKDGKYTEFRFAKNNSPLAYPHMDTWDNLKTTIEPTDYSLVPPIRNNSDEYIWMSTAIKEATSSGYQLASGSTWSIPILITGEKGIQGEPGAVGNTGADGLHGTNIIEAYRWGTSDITSVGVIDALNRDLPPANWSLNVQAKEEGKDVLYVIKNTQSYVRIFKTDPVTKNQIYEDKATVSNSWKGPFPITADTVRGQGQKGQVIYPAGTYSINETYTTTSLTAPYVIDSDGNYYLLNDVMSWKGSDNIEGKQHPKDSTIDKGGPWIKFEKFDAIYAKVGIIANGLVGSAVFNGDWMFSQEGLKVNNGVIDTTTLVSYATQGIAFNPDNPTNLKDFHQYPITFVPSIALNMKDGSGHLAAGAIRWDAMGNIYLNSITTNALTIKGIIKSVYQELKLEAPVDSNGMASNYFTLDNNHNVFIFSRYSNPYTWHDAVNASLNIDSLGNSYEFSIFNQCSYAVTIFMFGDRGTLRNTPDFGGIEIITNNGIGINKLSIDAFKTLDFILYNDVEHGKKVYCKQSLLVNPNTGVSLHSVLANAFSFTPLINVIAAGSFFIPNQTLEETSLVDSGFKCTFNSSMIDSIDKTIYNDGNDYAIDLNLHIKNHDLIQLISNNNLNLNASITPLKNVSGDHINNTLGHFRCITYAHTYLCQLFSTSLVQNDITYYDHILRVRGYDKDGNLVKPSDYPSLVDPNTLLQFMFQIYVI